MSNDFYQAFENRYRGSRALILERLQGYLPFVRPLLACYAAPRALDLGCGRGEWLELLRQEGVAARGVDLNEGMLSSARQLGLEVQHDDALAALRATADDSQLVVSAFHFVEHIPFDLLREMVQQALRVLVPGGLLIMETPNPENIIVAGCNFYLDPTHQRPIPPIQLSFLCDHEGFQRNKIVRWREPEVLHAPNYPIDLAAVFEGVSQDYAVVAQKEGRVEVMAANDEAFARDYGLTLRTLAVRYTLQMEQRFSQAEAHVEQKLHQLQLQLHLMEEREQEALKRLTEVYDSTSWRVTLPLRTLGSWSMSWRCALRDRMVSYATAHPRMRRCLVTVLDWTMPSLKKRMVRWCFGRAASVDEVDISTSNLNETTLAPRVGEIYRQLQKAVLSRQNG